MPSLPEVETLPAGGQVVLRVFRMSDVEDVTAACQDREISRWTAAIPWPYTEEHARGWISSHGALWERGEVAPLAVVGALDGELLGAVSLVFAPDHTADAGYWVARWGRNRGVATSALVAITEWGFEAVHLTSARLATMVGNLASERVAEKAGFSFVGESSDYRPPRTPDRTYPVKRWVRHRAPG